jgi:hypothetical protein
MVSFLSFENSFETSFPAGTTENFQTVTLHDPSSVRIGEPLRRRVGELPEAAVGLYRNRVEFTIAQPDGGAVIYLNESTDGLCAPETGIENSNNGGNGLAGFVDAMKIVDVEGGAQMTVNGNTILVEGIAVSQLTVDDFQVL